MACVLAMTPPFASSCSMFIEDGSNLQTNRCKDYDFNWDSGQTQQQKLQQENPPRCSSPCRIDANTSSVGQCKTEIPCGSYLNCQQDNRLCITNPGPWSQEKVDCSVSSRMSYVNDSATGARHQPGSPEMCNTIGTPIEHVVKQGLKRKPNCYVDDEACIPVKRITPFLNTPKEKKEERKKVLKITVRKLKSVDDPERFLRRTVTMNNTLKKIQREMKEEKKQIQNDRHLSSSKLNRVLSSSFLSNSYLYDDTFFIGVHDKIPDDNHELSDSLMNNLKDKLIDNTIDSGCASDCNNATKSCAPGDNSSSVTINSCEIKTFLENETECNRLPGNPVDVVYSQQSSQIDSNDKMDISHCGYQLSHSEGFDHLGCASSVCDRGTTILHDTLNRAIHVTNENANHVSSYEADSLESELTKSAISHLDAIASDSGNLDNFDVNHSVDYRTSAHSFISPSLFFDHIIQTVQ